MCSFEFSRFFFSFFGSLSHVMVVVQYAKTHTHTHTQSTVMFVDRLLVLFFFFSLLSLSFLMPPVLTLLRMRTIFFILSFRS
jgi:hypothetical protein